MTDDDLMPGGPTRPKESLENPLDSFGGGGRNLSQRPCDPAWNIAESLLDNVGSLHGPLQVTRMDDSDRPLRQTSAGAASLSATERGQRAVEAAGAERIFSVADEMKVASYRR